MTTKRIAQSFSRVAEYYDPYMQETGHIEAQRKIAEFIAGEYQSKDLVLDVATGTGILLEPDKK